MEFDNAKVIKKIDIPSLLNKINISILRQKKAKCAIINSLTQTARLHSHPG